MSRRIKVVLIFAVASLFLAATFIYQNPSRQSHYSLPTTNDDQLAGDRPLHITFLETGGSHDEVLAALVNMFGRLPRAKLSFFQRLSRYGSHDIMRAMGVPAEIPNTRPMEAMWAKDDPNRPIPDIIVSTTCEMDIKNFNTNLTTFLEKHNTYIYCVIHHADRWGNELEHRYHLEQALTPWVAKDRVEFLALSPHTADYLLNKSLLRWKVVAKGGVKPLVRHFVPVFPVKTPPVPPEGEDTALAFGLQGDFGQERRDYKMVFSRLGEFINPQKTLSSGSSDSDDSEKASDEEKKPATSRNVTLHLVGHGKHPPVPEAVKEQVKFDEGLNYLDFYTVLSRTFALLPAFASDTYLDRKASSTVPASLIAGTPLVATREILDAYAYLTDDVVWFQHEGETDFDVIGRVLKMTPAERKAKTEMVIAHRDSIIEKNIKLARIWTEEAFEKIGKRFPGIN